MKTQTVASAVLLVSSVLYAAGEPLAIEVSSIKPHDGGPPQGRGGSVAMSGARVSFRGFNIKALIWFAFDVTADFVYSSAPLDLTYYDVDVVAEGGRALTKSEFRTLMQMALADRFRLKTHWETRSLRVYALLTDRNGPKFKGSAPDANPSVEAVRDGHNLGSLVRKSTMAELAARISASAGLDCPVVDATGLAGYYDYRLTYSSQGRLVPGNFDVIDVFTAVREQLGLKLDRRVAPVKVLVIDHIEKPSEN